MAKYLDDSVGVPTLWQQIVNSFAKQKDVPKATTNAPLMDGTAAVGSETAFAKGDHVHPTDTSRAPVDHASTNSTYGLGDASKYGHVKLSDAINSSSGVTSGVAATPKAVQDALEAAKQYADEQERDSNTTYTISKTGSTVTLTGSDSSTSTFTDSDTTYSSGDGITLTGTTFSNAGVRQIQPGTEDGTISVNTNGEVEDVEVTGLGTAAFAAATSFATSAQGSKADSAYTHAVTNKGSQFASGLYKFATNAEGHVTSATAVQKSDITALGIPGSDTTYDDATTTESGLMSAEDKSRLDGMADNATANVGTVTSVSGKDGITGSVTESGTLGLNLASTTKLTNAAVTGTETVPSQIYPVALDKDGHPAVHVPWSNTTALNDMTGTLGVNKGGTGATTLTGIVKGNGTNAMSAAAASDVVSLLGTTAVNRATADASGNTISTTYMKASLKGASGGVAELDSGGKVPSTQLPSYVDDVIEGASKSDFPSEGEAGKIYVSLDDNKTWRWSGSAYVEISAGVTLGTTSSTAFRGDYGQTAYSHATDSGRLTTAKDTGLYKIATTAEGHVKSVTAVTKSDITDLGIPGTDTNTWNKVSTTQDGYISKLSGNTAQYLRGDGTWATPPNDDTDTTYSFEGGTNKLTVTPKGGEAQDINITPSIANNITGSGSSGYIAKFNGTGTITSGPQLGNSTTTYLRNDGTWGTPPNDNTTYVAATSDSLGLVKIGSNISVSSGTISLTKDNVTSALGYTPPTADTDTHHTAYLRAGGTGGTANASTTTGNTYLNLVENGANRSGVKLVPGSNMSITSDNAGNVTFNATNTTYSSKAAASGGTDVSLVTTGEKYNWNSKTSNTGTVTKVSTGAGLTGGDITGTGTVKANLLSETKLTNAAAAATETSGRVYPVALDKDGKLAVNVPWTDANTTYSSKAAASGGTDVSLVTTGEKYTWNNKSNLAIGTTATTAAAGNHTHTASLAKDTGTSAITLESAGKYKLTAGGSSVIFTMPTIPTNTDTKNTAGSTDTSSKIFLVGATSQAANPQTYSQDTAYVGTDGHLYSNSVQVVNLSGSQALTNKTYNGYTLAAACAKGVDTSLTASSTSTNVPTSAAVASLVKSSVSAITTAKIDEICV